MFMRTYASSRLWKSELQMLLAAILVHQGGGGEGNSIVFHLSFLTHTACQYDVT